MTHKGFTKRTNHAVSQNKAKLTLPKVTPRAAKIRQTFRVGQQGYSITPDSDEGSIERGHPKIFDVQNLEFGS